MPRVKVCSRCERSLPLEKFYNRNDGLYKKHKTCIECFKNYYHGRGNGNGWKPKKISGDIIVKHCDRCAFEDTCRANIWRQQFEPYCFVTAKYHGLYVKEYAG